MEAIVVDDQIAMHLIMKRMLGKIDKIEIVGFFQETTTAFSFLEKNRVDVVFVDINMAKESGLDFARRLRKNGWQMKIVFVTSHKEYALPAFDVYAFDYIVKPISQERLIGTIERILSEKVANEGEVMEMSSLKTLPPLIEPLTRREMQVIQLISNGLTNKEIAATYELTEGTVKNHVFNIFGKLQVRNRVQATTFAKLHKLLK